MANLTLTVLIADTHAKKVPAAGTEPLGAPNITTSFKAAPVTVIVKSLTAPAAVLPKSSVAVALRTFRIAVPLLPMTTPPAVTLSAVFVEPPDAVNVRAMLVEDVPVRVFEIVAPVVVVLENELVPESATFAAEKLPLLGPLPVITMSSNFALPPVKLEEFVAI